MKKNQFIYKTMGAIMIAAAMVLGSSTAFAQVKIGTNPTTIDATKNLEVEASTAGRKVSVDKTTGQVTIADGTQGNRKILTSDANGGASWQPRKITSTNIFEQGTGVGVFLPVSTTGYCNSINCATSLNLTGTFTTTESVNDVVIEVSGSYSVSNNTQPVTWAYWVSITGPGGYNSVKGPLFATESGTVCSSGLINFKNVLKNLAVGSYNVSVYAGPWKNPSAASWLGIGAYSNPGVCGDLTKSSVIISVSE
ncbi:hypothetical protein [Dyadobacter psychrotolerans]|uniref:Uncharacterized protein n=1 Tax=Dyadobacter psychrotolerans TaxID=2541721 RepID=A0A4V2Z428_9BACT|nr:hypothetical protein [Dyadobacter psychrotolerans]TDE14428.1 hypothetical protein E0F88_14600 [Dyadobacter psychrotolerans]